MSTSVSRSAVVVNRPAADASTGFLARLGRLVGRARAWIHAHPRLRAPYRIMVALAGLAVMALGLLLVPLPGPGWLIVFVGVALLGSEFPAAARVSAVVRRLAHGVRRWWRSRRPTPREP